MDQKKAEKNKIRDLLTNLSLKDDNYKKINNIEDTMVNRDP